MYEKTNCVLMVQRYKHCLSTTNLFSETPIFFNKTVWKTHIKECSCYELFKRKRATTVTLKLYNLKSNIMENSRLTTKNRVSSDIAEQIRG